MPHLIDRRLNPRDKSLGNRQRFLRRARAQIKEAVNKAINDRNVSDIGDGGKISIPSRGIGEPRFRHDAHGGRRERVLPGNKEFVPGDRIAKPSGGAGGGAGKKGSDHGEGEDDFVFALTRDEFLDLFFDDLELPDLVKTSLKETFAYKPYRAGFTNSGTPTNLNVLRTMRNSIGRRIALRRPVVSRMEELALELEELQSRNDLDISLQRRLAELSLEYEELERRRRAVPYIDPIDIRYNRFEQRPQPKTKAVMFCLMDVSGSMGQHEKDLAKRFFILLHLFLRRRYEKVEIVFIRHTHQAQVVDEDAFFYSQETGGTVVSTALKEMLQEVEARFPIADWNIYGAQASDGDNFSDDTGRCVELLTDKVLPICQYYAYVEILDQREFQIFGGSNNGKELWRGYQPLEVGWPNFSMKHIAEPGHIYPVFRELFAKQSD
jgi:uncharacterized sporulation protein YeaH/YhbH (DUF444 family)